MITGNKGEWSEPYVLLKLVGEQEITLGDVDGSGNGRIAYSILKLLRHMAGREIEFSFLADLVKVKAGDLEKVVARKIFVEKSRVCFEEITNSIEGDGAFSIPIIEEFLKEIFISELKAKSNLKNDISLQVVDLNTHTQPTLGFSIKSRLGSPATLINASRVTNFTFNVLGLNATEAIIDEIDGIRNFSKKLKSISDRGGSLVFNSVDNKIFRSNLQLIDSHFEKIIAHLLVGYYQGQGAESSYISNLVQKMKEENPLGYDLEVNDMIYELKVKQFLAEYALGMRAGEVWQRNYQASGGYLVVMENGEIVCYHFYFAKKFEDYLFHNTRLETGSSSRNGFGSLYIEDSCLRIKLNLQVRFID